VNRVVDIVAQMSDLILWERLRIRRFVDPDMLRLIKQ
jgi:hypothetical protein